MQRTSPKGYFKNPYVLCLTADGQLFLLSLEQNVGRTQVVGQLYLLRANLKSKSKMLTICAYRDTSGLFVKDVAEVSQFSNTKLENDNIQGDADGTFVNSPRPVVEDEDDLLYGNSAPSLFTGAGLVKEMKGSEECSARAQRGTSKTHMYSVSQLTVNFFF